jgi:hypothetical protein
VLSGNFESNGPDVKIHGTAAHITEKYMALARDANSSGDQVMAENYFQHAEHYYRIIMAAQAQFQEQTGQRMRPEFDQLGGDAGQSEGGYEGDDEGDDEQPFTGEQQPRHNDYRSSEPPRGYEPQPSMPRPHNNEPRGDRSDGRPYEGRSGGDNRQGGGHGDGRNQQGDMRGRRNRHRNDNNRFRQHQGGGMPANPADIAAMAAANGNGFQDNERRRDRTQEPGVSPEPSSDE